MRVYFVVAVVIAGILVAGTRPGSADEIPPCALPAGVAERSFAADLPTVLKTALWVKYGEIVPPGGDFDSTDVVRTQKDRRAIFVWQRGQKWIVATKHGGRGYNDPVLAFDVTSDGESARLMAEIITIPLLVCRAATRLIDVQ